MHEGIIKDDETAAPAAAEGITKQIMKLNIFDDDDDGNRSDDDNNEKEAVAGVESKEEDDTEEDEIIQGLSNFTLDPQVEDEYTSKGPIFRRNEVTHRAAPYQQEQQQQQQQQQPKPQQPQQQPSDEQTVEQFLEQFDISLIEGAKLLVENELNDVEKESKGDIPILPDCNVTTPANNLIVKNLDSFYNPKEAVAEPRLLLRQIGGGYIVLPNAVHVSIETTARKLGVVLPRIILPADVAREAGDSVEILFQPNPREQRTVPGVAKIIEAKTQQGQTCYVVQDQFMELSPFVIKGMSGIDVLLQDVTKADIDAAVALVNRQDSQDIFKTYGPNNDSMLMTLCCKKDDTPTIRAQVFALSARILSEKDISLRNNLVMKNASGLSALDYTTVTNNARIAVYLAEIFFTLGQDIFCRDGSGNTILHVMARKGDSVAPTMETLMSLRFRHGTGGKVYSGNVTNGKDFLPLHIAAMSTKCPQNILRILRDDFEQSVYGRTSDGSLPLHLACQYSMDPNLLASLLYYTKAPTANERRNDGFTPLHLVAARNEARDVKLGLIPLDEMTQVRMIKLLLEHGADKKLTVENYQPADLLKVERAQAHSLFRLNSLGNQKQERMMFAGGVSPPYGGCDSPGGASCGDRSPVMSQPSPTSCNDPFVGTAIYSSDSEASPNPHQANNWQSSSPYGYQYSPAGHNGSVSSGVDNFSGASDESDEDNNSGIELDAIAQVLITHPSIQAAIEAATRLN